MSESDGLGFVFKKGKLTLKKFTSNNMIGIFLPVGFKFTDYSNTLIAVNSKITLLKSTPIFTNDKYKLSLKPVADVISDSLETIEKCLQDISHYADINAENFTNKHTCQLSYTEIDTNFIETFVEGATTYLDKIDKTVTATTATTDPVKYQKFVTELFFTKDFMSSFQEELVDRLHIMSSLARSEIPEDLPRNLEAKECIELGDIETLTVTYCKKYKDGMFCEASLTSVKTSQEYSQYVPVAYNNVQLKLLHDQQALLQTATGGWELLSCQNDFEYIDLDKIEDFLDCKTISYQNPCTENLLTDNFDKILENCNFTAKAKVETISRTETGILFQDPDLIIQEISKVNKQSNTFLPQKYPMHIISNYNLKVKLGNKELELLPYYRAAESEVGIKYTYLTDEIVTKIKSLARTADLLDMIEPENYLDLIYICLFIIVFPAAIITYTVCCKECQNTGFLNDCCKNRSNDIIKHISKKANYARNKQVGKRVREQELVEI